MKLHKKIYWVKKYEHIMKKVFQNFLYDFQNVTEYLIFQAFSSFRNYTNKSRWNRLI